MSNFWSFFNSNENINPNKKIEIKDYLSLLKAVVSVQDENDDTIDDIGFFLDNKAKSKYIQKSMINSLLKIAIEKNNYRLVRIILEQGGADPNKIDGDITSIEFAEGLKHTDDYKHNKQYRDNLDKIIIALNDPMNKTISNFREETFHGAPKKSPMRSVSKKSPMRSVSKKSPMRSANRQSPMHGGKKQKTHKQKTHKQKTHKKK
jgi:hypothetical protein